MNKISLAVSAALALGAAFSANAQSGTINFEGNVTATTCSVSFNGGTTTDATITLPTVAEGSLTAGNSAGRTPITLVVGAGGGCTATDYALELNPNSSAIVSASGRLANQTPVASNGADNVSVALRDDQNQLIDLSKGPWSSARVAPATPITFGSEYYAEGGNATAGDVTANVQYTIDYN